MLIFRIMTVFCLINEHLATYIYNRTNSIEKQNTCVYQQLFILSGATLLLTEQDQHIQVLFLNFRHC